MFKVYIQNGLHILNKKKWYYSFNFDVTKLSNVISRAESNITDAYKFIMLKINFLDKTYGNMHSM